MGGSSKTCLASKCRHDEKVKSTRGVQRLSGLKHALALQWIGRLLAVEKHVGFRTTHRSLIYQGYASIIALKPVVAASAGEQLHSGMPQPSWPSGFPLLAASGHKPHGQQLVVLQGGALRDASLQQGQLCTYNKMGAIQGAPDEVDIVATLQRLPIGSAVHYHTIQLIHRREAPAADAGPVCHWDGPQYTSAR